MVFVILGTVLLEPIPGDTNEVVASIEGTTTLPTTLGTTTKRSKPPRTGTTSRKQKRRPSPIKRNRHITKFSKIKSSTRDPLARLAYRMNLTVPNDGKLEILGFTVVEPHVEIFVRGGFRVYIEGEF